MSSSWLGLYYSWSGVGGSWATITDLPATPVTFGGEYRFVAIRGSNALGELAALDKRLEFRLDKPSLLTFRINAANPTAQFVSDLDTDVIVYRDGIPLMRAVITATRDDLDESSHYIEVSAMDYRGRLEFRLVQSDQTFSAEKDVDIAWQAILNAQAETNGAMGIRRGFVDEGVELTGGFPAGISVGEALDLVSKVDEGFDWDVDANLRLNIYRPRGRVSERVLDYGGLVSEVAREFAAGEFANSVRASGDESIPSVVVGTGSTSQGRWDRQVGFPQIDSTSLLAGLAVDELSRSQNEAVSTRVRLRSGEGLQAWGGPADVGLGDTIRLVIKSNRLNVNTLTRVREIDVTVGNDGREDVFFVLDGPRRTFQERINDVLQRLTELERQ